MSHKKRSRHKTRKTKKRKFAFIALALLAIAFTVIIGRWSAHRPAEKTESPPPADIADSSTTLPLPPWLARANPAVKQAYTFAFTHPEELSYIPCYCGCDRLGHTSVRDCYIQNRDPSGRIIASHHAEYCNICLGIALDTRTALDQHLTLPDIRSRIEHFYGRFGRPTPTPLPESSPSTNPSHSTQTPPAGR